MNLMILAIALGWAVAIVNGALLHLRETQSARRVSYLWLNPRLLA